MFTLMFLTVCCFGCSGGGTEVELEKVSGVVTMDGKPLAYAVVVFKPQEGNPSSGQTDVSGKYELVHRANAPGAIPGKHTVWITQGQPPTSEGDPESNIDSAATGVGSEDLETPKGKAAPKNPIPAKYNTKTTLTAEVKQGENTIDFKLESK